MTAVTARQTSWERGRRPRERVNLPRRALVPLPRSDVCRLCCLPVAGAIRREVDREGGRGQAADAADGHAAHGG